MSADHQNDARLRYARLATVPLRSVGSVRASTWRGFVGSVKDIVDHREMLTLLVKRDLKSKYKDSSLGFLWSLARPLMQLVIYYVVLGQFIGAARGIDDFAIFIFAGLTAMGLFTEIANSGTGSILSNAGLVKKVYVPRELFPLATTGSALFNFAVQLMVLLGATFLVGKPPIHADAFYLVPSLAILLVYGLAFALLFSALNVYLRDVQYLIEVATMLLFWASPVVYSWTMVRDIVTNPVLLELYTDNPLTLAVIGFQRAFWLAGADSAQPSDLLLRQLVALGVGLVLLLLSHKVFLRLQGNFAQEL